MRIYYKLYIIVITTLLAVPIYIHVKGHGHSDVLYHYIFKDFNIAKLRCAVFLLDNMRYHASVYGKGQEELPFLLGSSGCQYFLYPDIIE